MTPARGRSQRAAPSEDALAVARLDRRNLLKLAGLGAAGAAAGAVTLPGFGGEAVAATPLWPGHKPGKIYLGAAAAGDLSRTTNITGPVGLCRTFYKWGDVSREMKQIKADHANRRLPWVSYKPPSSSGQVWKLIAAGRYDADIQARARAYATLSGPVVVTFNHEPHTDLGHAGAASDFAAAWTRIHDVMKAETGLKNVAHVPIVGDWCFNPVNKNGNIGGYLSAGVLSRCHFVGVDLYQNRSGDGYAVRLGRILNWLDTHGADGKMVGVGETGSCNTYGTPNAAQWWTSSWTWATQNASRVAAISYFNSSGNNNSGNNWLLTESAAKLAAFKASLASPTATRL